jgi:hypothetical protein
MERSLKKTQIALFSLVTLIFMFGIVLFSTIKQKDFIENYKFGTEEKIKELFWDYLNNNYQYAKKEEILDHLFYNSFSFFNLTNNSFFSKKLLRTVNIYNYTLEIKEYYPKYGYFERKLEETGLDFYSGKKLAICLGNVPKNEKCDVVFNEDKYKENYRDFLNLIFDSYIKKNKDESLNLVFKNVKDNFKKNIENFFNFSNFEEGNFTIVKKFLNNNITFPISNKYWWILNKTAEELSLKNYESYFEKIFPNKWFYVFEKDYLIICRESYNINIKEFFNFYNWKRDNLKTIDCLAFKIKDKEGLREFLENEEVRLFLIRKDYNLEQYANLNLFYLLSSNAEKEINKKEEGQSVNYFLDFNELLNWFKSIKKDFDKNKYLKFNLSKKEIPDFIKQFGKYKTFSIGKNELILLSDKIALTNIYSKNKENYELTIKVKDGCSFLPFSSFFYVEDEEGFKNLIGKDEDLLLQSFEKLNSIGDYYFYHVIDLKTEKEYCILSEEDSLLD